MIITAKLLTKLWAHLNFFVSRKCLEKEEIAFVDFCFYILMVAANCL